MSLRVYYTEEGKQKLFEAKKEGNKGIAYTYNDWKTTEYADRDTVNKIVFDLRKTFEVSAIIGGF